VGMEGGSSGGDRWCGWVAWVSDIGGLGTAALAVEVEAWFTWRGHQEPVASPFGLVTDRKEYFLLVDLQLSQEIVRG